MNTLTNISDKKYEATPRLIINKERLQKNIDKIQKYTSANQLKLFAHLKTFKSSDLTAFFYKSGIRNFCITNSKEAEHLKTLHDIEVCMAFPPIGEERIESIYSLLNSCPVTVLVDCREHLGSLTFHPGLRIAIEIDVGLHRCGINSLNSLREIVSEAKTKNIPIAAFYIYLGHLYEQSDPNSRKEEYKNISLLLEEYLSVMGKEGLPDVKISSGASPTLFESHLIKNCSELRVGNGFIGDTFSIVTHNREIEETAIQIESTVVSSTQAGQIVIDAGAKSLSRYQSQGGNGYSPNFGLVPSITGAYVSRVNEELSMVKLPNGESKVKVGDRIRIIPTHASLAISCFTHAYLESPDGSYEKIKIDLK